MAAVVIVVLGDVTLGAMVGAGRRRVVAPLGAGTATVAMKQQVGGRHLSLGLGTSPGGR